MPPARLYVIVHQIVKLGQFFVRPIHRVQDFLTGLFVLLCDLGDDLVPVVLHYIVGKQPIVDETKGLNGFHTVTIFLFNILLLHIVKALFVLQEMISTENDIESIELFQDEPVEEAKSQSRHADEGGVEIVDGCACGLHYVSTLGNLGIYLDD